MSSADTLAHLNEAIEQLTLEAYRGSDLEKMERVNDFTIAEELKRIDMAIGPKGESMFALLADRIIAAYVEIVAARSAMQGRSDNG
jgi:hypothetical protein